MICVDEYAKAIFDIAAEENKLEEIKSELSLVSAVFSENPEYIRLLDTPALKKEERLELIDSAFAALSENTVNLLKLLCERRLIGGIFKLCEVFLEMYDERIGIVRVEAITAVPMTASQCEAMRARLSAKLSRTIVLTNTVDASILGGVKLRYSGLQLDGSVKTRLDSFEESLKSTVI
jgi:F-type H+-transporting ATPase subunit delta